jgi:transcriptional regulator with XRE-family HTH domain
MSAENDNKSMMHFGDYIHELRVRKEVTLRDFCREFNYDPAAWSKIERGILPPPKDNDLILRMSKFLDLSYVETTAIYGMALNETFDERKEPPVTLRNGQTFNPS